MENNLKKYQDEIYRLKTRLFQLEKEILQGSLISFDEFLTNVEISKINQKNIIDIDDQKRLDKLKQKVFLKRNLDNAYKEREYIKTELEKLFSQAYNY